jgi:hypothetical protein
MPHRLRSTEVIPVLSHDCTRIVYICQLPADTKSSVRKSPRAQPLGATGGPRWTPKRSVQNGAFPVPLRCGALPNGCAMAGRGCSATVDLPSGQPSAGLTPQIPFPGPHESAARFSRRNPATPAWALSPFATSCSCHTCDTPPSDAAAAPHRTPATQPRLSTGNRASMRGKAYKTDASFAGRFAILGRRRAWRSRPSPSPPTSPRAERPGSVAVPLAVPWRVRLSNARMGGLWMRAGAYPCLETIGDGRFFAVPRSELK